MGEAIGESVGGNKSGRLIEAKIDRLYDQVGSQQAEDDMRSKIVAAALAVGLAALAAQGVTQAQNFPARPVTFVVPWPAGGATDVALRALATATEKHLGQS